METIIGLLLILLPVILKLIGKKLEAAGTTNTPKPTGSSDVGSWVQEALDEEELEVFQPETHPGPEVCPQPQAAPTSVEEATPSVFDFNEYMRKRQAAKPARKAPALVEEDKEEKEKIDPKKLVIYSEIMSPKYKE